jgi:DNA polymerase III gamma/tau subunit
MLSSGSYLLLPSYQKSYRDLLLEIYDKKIQSNPDILIINEEKNIGIDKTRELKLFFQVKSWSGEVKTAIIINGERMTVEAQNSILKILEEPGKNNYIIITAQNPYLLLPTILSRCQLLKGKGLPLTAEGDHFNRIISSGIKKRIEIFEELNELNAQEACKKLLVQGQHHLFAGKEKKATAKALVKIMKAQRMLQANLTADQVFDWLAVNM